MTMSIIDPDTFEIRSAEIGPQGANEQKVTVSN